MIGALRRLEDTRSAAASVFANIGWEASSDAKKEKALKTDVQVAGVMADFSERSGGVFKVQNKPE